MQYLIGKAPLRQPFEKMRVDARSVQKTPAGVLIVRRGLFFVKRQRRYPHIFKRKRKLQECP